MAPDDLTLQRGRLDQRSPYGLAIHAHALRDSSHRDTTEMDLHRFRSFFDS